MKRKGIFTTENRESTEAISVANTHDLPEGFQMTELGPLPKEWRVVRLEEVALLERGLSWSKGDEEPHGIGVLSIPDILTNGRLNPFPRVHVSKQVPSNKLLAKGDILLVGSSGAVKNVGRSGVLRKEPVSPLTFASFTVRLRTRSDIFLQDFALYLIQSTWIDFARFSKRAADGKYNLQLRQLQSASIPLPPLDEQRAIASVLRTVQRAKEATEGVIAALRELKKSLMQHLFTYGPVPVTERERVALQETEIGPIPAHWRVVRLGEVVDVKGGKRLPKGDEFASNPTPYPYIRIVDFKNGSVDIRNLKFLTEEQHILLNRYIITSNDVYISIAGTIGLVGSVPEELNGAHLTENAARLILNTNRLYRQFLVVALQSDMVQAQIQARATKTSQPKLALARIKEIPIPLPPLDEQREIARMLQAVDAKIAAEQARRAALEELFKSLLHLLMTGKVRVKEDLGSQNANS
jgi:type I restriction enzyme S subunit